MSLAAESRLVMIRNSRPLLACSAALSPRSDQRKDKSIKPRRRYSIRIGRAFPNSQAGVGRTDSGTLALRIICFAPTNLLA
jgi:hypothetical protein